MSMTKILKIDNEGLFLLGQALQEQEHLREYTPYLELEGGRVIAFGEKELQKLKQRIGQTYVEIRCISHTELHKLLDEFVWSIDNEEARKAGEQKCGIGDTLRALDKHINGTWDFSVFVARKWLESAGIQITE
jgi:hypothetical protein